MRLDWAHGTKNPAPSCLAALHGHRARQTLEGGVGVAGAGAGRRDGHWDYHPIVGHVVVKGDAFAPRPLSLGAHWNGSSLTRASVQNLTRVPTAQVDVDALFVALERLRGGLHPPLWSNSPPHGQLGANRNGPEPCRRWGRGSGECKHRLQAPSAAPRRVAATTGKRAVASTGTPAQACAWAGEIDLTSLPDDAVTLVLAAIDQPQAAARMLSTCRRVRESLPAPGSHVSASELGPSAPMVIQVQFMSAFLHSAAAKRQSGLDLAATHGWVGLLPRLVEHGERLGVETLLQAVRHNHLGVVQWLHLHTSASPEFSWGVTCSAAAHAGHPELLQWARAQGAPWECFDVAPCYPCDPRQYFEQSTCMAAAHGGHLALLQWARAQTPPAPWQGEHTCCEAAAEGGHLELLQWVSGQFTYPPLNDRVCSAAARGGHLELLQWARAQGAPWDEWTCRLAAEGGHLELLQWARAQGAPWDEWTCRLAAKAGNLPMLQWARAQTAPAPWGEATCSGVADGDHLELLQWARAQIPPAP